MPKRPFWEADKASITVPEPLSKHLADIAPQAPKTGALKGRSKVVHTRQGEALVKNLSFSENLSALYELWNAQRHELEASSEPLPKRIEALGRLARVLPQLQVAERLHKAKRGEKAIDEMSDEELMQMLSKESKE